MSWVFVGGKGVFEFFIFFLGFLLVLGFDIGFVVVGIFLGRKRYLVLLF